MAKSPLSPAEQALEDGRKRQAEAVAAQEARDKLRPTPSQEENDRAKLGVLDIDDKEDDGSGLDPVASRSSVADGPAPYETRASSARPAQAPAKGGKV